jgi:hypothetical protein
MTSAAHTPGPWRLFDVFTDLEIVTDRSTANETESIVQFKGQRNATANARLMASAPELLEALEELLFITHPDTFGGSMEDARGIASAAIAKAKATR